MENFLLKLKEAKQFILDLIFPKECLVCGKEATYLCQKCFKEIEFNRKFYCALCKKQSQFAAICPDCQKGNVLSAVWVAADYNNEILQALIHNFKYKYVEDLSQTLANLIIRYLELNRILPQFEINSANTIIVPVPLHKKRFLLRGFNQSELLAERIGKFYGIKNQNLLIRKINTQSQINFKRSERQLNVKEAFDLNRLELEEIGKNKKIIVIDDVLTTGSTLKECANVLAKFGFKEIYGLVIAQRED